MINPSAPGWIDKFFSEQSSVSTTLLHNSKDFYIQTRATGFIYGHVTHFATLNFIDTTGWTHEELSKVALLNTLIGIYQLEKQTFTKETFITTLHHFYNSVHQEETNLLKKLLPTESLSLKLEKIINTRVQTNENIVSKNFSHIITNALLFMDVVAFKIYLRDEKIKENYFRKLEETIITVVTNALNSKQVKSDYDKLLVKLFEASIKYTKFFKIQSGISEAIDLSFLSTNLEKYYIMDLAVMAIWSDETIDITEQTFLQKLGHWLEIEQNYITDSIATITSFIRTHKSEISFFNYSNPIKHFYDQTTNMVILLINRNKKRLIKEISESGELMVLLAQSTNRELNASEKKKIKRQLLDICKTIPSLAIFIVPGGSLLLPILIKFIPQLLPSAFNENLDDKKEEI